jgi:hypothetical protein
VGALAITKPVNRSTPSAPPGIKEYLMFCCQYSRPFGASSAPFIASHIINACCSDVSGLAVTVWPDIESEETSSKRQPNADWRSKRCIEIYHMPTLKHRIALLQKAQYGIVAASTNRIGSLAVRIRQHHATA